jgi:hypothetical protein
VPVIFKRTAVCNRYLLGRKVIRIWFLEEKKSRILVRILPGTGIDQTLLPISYFKLCILTFNYGVKIKIVY